MIKTTLFTRFIPLTLSALLLSCGGGGGGGSGGSGSSTDPNVPPPNDMRVEYYQWAMVNGNIVLVDPANANGAITVDRIGASMAYIGAAYSGAFSGATQSFNGLKERFAIYTRFNQIYKVDLLKQAAPPTALRVSSENAFVNCSFSNYDFQVIQDFIAPEKSWILYASFATTNGTTDCTKPPTGYKAVRLDDGPSQAPRTVDLPIAALRDSATGTVNGYIGYYDTTGVINRYDAAMSNPKFLYGVAGGKVAVPIYMGQTKDQLLFGALNINNTSNLIAPAAYSIATNTWATISPAANTGLPYEFLSFDGTQLFGAQKSSSIPVAPAQTSYALYKIPLDATSAAQRFAGINDLFYVNGNCGPALSVTTRDFASGALGQYVVPHSGANVGVVTPVGPLNFTPATCSGARIYGRTGTSFVMPQTLEILEASTGTSVRTINNSNWFGFGESADEARYKPDVRWAYAMYRKLDSATSLSSFYAINTLTNAEIKLGELIGAGMIALSVPIGNEGLLVIGGKSVVVNGATQPTYDIYRYDMSKANSLTLVAAGYR